MQRNRFYFCKTEKCEMMKDFFFFLIHNKRGKISNFIQEKRANRTEKRDKETLMTNFES